MRKVPTSSNQKVARVAGLAYILVILTGWLKVHFIEPAVVSHGRLDSGAGILAYEPLFRIGIACELGMYLLVVVLSIALYILLKPVDRRLALSAFYFRFGEAIVGTVSILLSGLIPLLLLEEAPAPDDPLLQVMIDSFLNSRTAGLNMVLTFIGIGGTIFCYLFYLSRFVPRALAAWGIATYTSMFVLGFLNILYPERPDAVETTLFSAGALFEVVFGFWLLVKGVDTSQESETMA